MAASALRGLRDHKKLSAHVKILVSHILLFPSIQGQLAGSRLARTSQTPISSPKQRRCAARCALRKPSTEHEARSREAPRSRSSARSDPASIPIPSRRYRSNIMADQTGKQLTALNALIAGFTKGLPGGASTFLLRNTPYSQTDLLTLL